MYIPALSSIASVVLCLCRSHNHQWQHSRRGQGSRASVGLPPLIIPPPMRMPRLPAITTDTRPCLLTLSNTIFPKEVQKKMKI